jgi:hypothetical protein
MKITEREKYQKYFNLLREGHDIYVLCIPTLQAGWTYKIINLGNPEVEVPPYKDVCGEDWGTYDEALKAGVTEAFNLINNG